jgi:thioredoxin-disulfide reductase
LKTLLIEGKAIGGLFIDAGTIENYPGFEKITGVELAQKFEKQLKKLPVNLIYEQVEDIKKKGNLFEIKTNKSTFSSKSLIITSGTRYREIELKDEKKFVGKGISYCATCDAPLFQGKDVAVIGGGNSAMHYALFLAEICSKVYVIHRSEFRADPILLEKLRKMKNVEFKQPHVVAELIGEKMLNSIKITNSKSNREEILKVSGIFISIGQDPNTSFLKSLDLKLNQGNYIDVDQNMQTTLPGVFAAGDVTGTAGQVVIACGQGAKAAMNAASYLKEK